MQTSSRLPTRRISGAAVLVFVTGAMLWAQDPQRLAEEAPFLERQKRHEQAYEQYKAAASKADYRVLIEALEDSDTEIKALSLAAALNLPFTGKLHVARAALMNHQWNQPVSVQSPERLSQGSFRQHTRSLLRETLGRDVNESLYDKATRDNLVAELENLIASSNAKQAAQMPLTSEGQAGEIPISKDRIAELLAYPAGKIVLADQTTVQNEQARRKGRALAISSHRFTAADHSFAPISITVAQAGVLLTPEVRHYAERSLSSQSASPRIRKLDFPGLGYGFAGLGMLGPGGSEERVILTIPAVQKDVQVTLMIPGDRQLLRIPAGEKHYAILANPEVLIDRLIQCAETAARAVATMPSHVTDAAKGARKL